MKLVLEVTILQSGVQSWALVYMTRAKHEKCQEYLAWTCEVLLIRTHTLGRTVELEPPQLPFQIWSEDKMNGKGLTV